MDIDALTANIKPLDLSGKPAISLNEQDYFRHYDLNIEERYPEVTHYFGHFASGRFDIVAHYFQHAKATRTCFVLHGYYDHSGLYSKIIEHCIQRNISVVIYDFPGHGLSTGKRACIGDFSEYQAVLRDVIRVFANHTPEPWCVIAQSTGAAVLMDYLLSDTKKSFSKAVLLAPLVRPVKWRISLLAYELLKYFVSTVPRRFSVNSNDKNFITFLKNRDPFQASSLSLRWVGALKNWIKRFKHLPVSHFSPLIIQGKSDETVDWQHNIPEIKSKFPNAKVLYLKQGRHHLANEREDILAKILSAIDMYFDTAIMPSDYQGTSE